MTLQQVCFSRFWGQKTETKVAKTKNKQAKKKNIQHLYPLSHVFYVTAEDSDFSGLMKTVNVLFSYVEGLRELPRIA